MVADLAFPRVVGNAVAKLLSHNLRCQRVSHELCALQALK